MDKNLKREKSPGGKESLSSSGFNRCRHCEERYDALCGVLSCDQLDRLDQLMTWTHFEPGKIIFLEGDKVTDYYSVSEGVVRLVKLLPDGRRTIVDFLFKGDFLGLNSKGLYPYTAEAITPVRLCRFPKPRLQEMFEDIPKMESKLLGIYGEKLAQAHEQMADLARKAPREKLAAFLLRLTRHKNLVNSENAIFLPMSREDISDYLGLTIESISRTFSAFAKEGLIEIENRKKVKILDPEELETIADNL